MSQTPRLEEVIEDTISERLASFWTAVPARVSKFDPDLQTATIEIPVVNAIVDGEGTKHWHHAKIQNVMVLFPGSNLGTNHYRITFPIGQGATGLYIVSTVDLAAWRASDGRGNINLDSHKSDRNHLGNGYFLPSGTRGTTSETPEVDLNKMVLSGKKVLIGDKDGTQPTFMANNFMSALNTLFVELSAAVATIGGGGSAAATAIDAAYEAFVSSAGTFKTTKAEVV